MNLQTQTGKRINQIGMAVSFVPTARKSLLSFFYQYLIPMGSGIIALSLVLLYDSDRSPISVEKKMKNIFAL
jgi:hypothetical protein